MVAQPKSKINKHAKKKENAAKCMYTVQQPTIKPLAREICFGKDVAIKLTNISVNSPLGAERYSTS